MDEFEGVSQEPLSLHKYLYARHDAVNRTDPSGNFDFDLRSLSSTLGTVKTLAANTFSLVRNAGYWVYFTLHRVPQLIETVDFVVSAVAVSLGLALYATETAADVLERMSRRIVSEEEEFSPGWSRRGFQVGEAAGQNLADNYPLIDNFEDGVATSVRSITRTQNLQVLLNEIGNSAGELDRDTWPDTLRGFDRKGNRITIHREQVRERSLLMVIPDEPPSWDARILAREVRRISNAFGVVIKVLPTRRLRR